MYTGRRLDAETGLYYYRARYYDPHLRRFIETDPIGYAGGMNLYTYVKNSPVNWIDPWGLTREDIIAMTELVRATQPDLDVPKKVGVKDLGRENLVGLTDYTFLTIWVDDRYLEPLNCNQLIDLFDTIVHEAIHRTRPRNDMLRDPHPDIYAEAARRTKKQVGKIKAYCKGRKISQNKKSQTQKMNSFEVPPF